MSNSDLERIFRELGGIQDRLSALPDDAFAERYELRIRQEELRDQMATSRISSFDEKRSTNELLVELSGQRARLASIESQHIDMVSQSGSLDAGAINPDEGLNREMDRAAGAGEIRSRIGRIKGILQDRGVDVPEEA